MGFREVVETSLQLCIVLDYAAGGELFEYVADKRAIASEQDIQCIFAQIVDGKPRRLTLFFYFVAFVFLFSLTYSSCLSHQHIPLHKRIGFTDWYPPFSFSPSRLFLSLSFSSGRLPAST